MTTASLTVQDNLTDKLQSTVQSAANNLAAGLKHIGNYAATSPKRFVEESKEVLGSRYMIKAAFSQDDASLVKKISDAFTFTLGEAYLGALQSSLSTKAGWLGIALAVGATAGCSGDQPNIPGYEHEVGDDVFLRTNQLAVEPNSLYDSLADQLSKTSSQTHCEVIGRAQDPVYWGKENFAYNVDCNGLQGWVKGDEVSWMPVKAPSELPPVPTIMPTKAVETVQIQNGFPEYCGTVPDGSTPLEALGTGWQNFRIQRGDSLSPIITYDVDKKSHNWLTGNNVYTDGSVSCEDTVLNP